MRSPRPGAVDSLLHLNTIPVSFVIDDFLNPTAAIQTMRSLYFLQVNPTPSIVARMLMMEIRCAVPLEIADVK